MPVEGLPQHLQRHPVVALQLRHQPLVPLVGIGRKVRLQLREGSCVGGWVGGWWGSTILVCAQRQVVWACKEMAQAVAMWTRCVCCNAEGVVGGSGIRSCLRHSRRRFNSPGGFPNRACHLTAATRHT